MYSSLGSGAGAGAGAGDQEQLAIFDPQYTAQLERDELKKRKIEWASKQTMSSVKFNDELSKVIEIGTRPVTDFMLPMLRIFCMKNGIQVPNTATKKEDLLRLILQHHKNGSLRDSTS